VERNRKILAHLAKVWRFVLHFGEMCLAMCVGAGVFGLVFTKLVAGAGYDHPYQQLPELSAFVMLLAMTLPMAAWMRVRGMETRSISEMSAAMAVETLLLVAALRTGVVQGAALLSLQHLLMMPAMLIPMLLRLDAYTDCHTHRRKPQTA
jgi:hypothetical protein